MRFLRKPLVMSYLFKYSGIYISPLAISRSSFFILWASRIAFSKILRTVAKIATSYLYDMIWYLSKNLNFF